MADPCGYNYNGKFFKDKKSLMDYLNGDGKSKMLSDIKEVSKLKEENVDLKNQLTDLFKGAVEALKVTERSFKDKIREVNNSVSEATKLFNTELKNKKLTPAQHRNILNKLAKLSKSSNSKTLESNLNDVVKSIETASYKANRVELLSDIGRSIKKAISNLSNAKLGGKSSNIDTFKKLLSIDPKNINDRYVQEYKEVVELLSDPTKLKQSGITLLDIDRRAKVLLYEYGFDKANLENASGKYSDYIYENDLEMTSEGFEEVVGKMKSKDLLSEEEYQSLLDNKSKIIPRKPVERTSKEPYTAEQKKQVKQSVKNSIKEYRDGAMRDVDFINNEEKEVVDSVFNAMDRVGDEFMDSLSDKDLDRVENTIALLNQGVVQGDLNFFVNNKIKSYEKAQKVKSKIKEIDTKWRSLIINPKIKKTIFDVVDFLKGDYRKGKNLSKLEQADRVLQTAIDKALGVTGDILNNNLLAEQASNVGKDQNYRLTMKNKYVNPIINFLEKTYKGDKIKQVESMIRTNMFAYQRMFENGNPGDNHRNISDIVNSIKNKDNNLYSEKEVEFITRELEKFADLDFDSNRYYETLTDAEKTIIRKIDEFYESDIRNKAVATSKFGSGKTLNITESYRPVSMVFDGETQVSLEEAIKNSNEEFFKPSFKAGNLEKKEGGLETEGMIINIKDPLFSMEKYIDDISLRYHNLDSVRVVNDALKAIRESSDIKGNPKFERIVKYFQDIINKDVENLVSGSVGAQIFSGNSEVAIASNKILSNASVNKLIGISKVVAESYSNIVRTSASLSTYVKGIGVYTELLKGNLDIDKIFYNIGFSQSGRTFGNIFDFNVKKDSANVDVPKESGNKAPNKMPSKIVNEIYKMLNKSGVEDAKLLSEEIAKAMIETPDKTIAKPLSLGIFDRVFEKLTGEKPDYNKIENGDVDYLDKHKENIKEAVFSANKTVAMMIGSKNPFEMVSNNMVNIKDPTYKKLYTQFNSFFTNHSKSQATANYVEVQKLFRTNEYKTKADKIQAYKTMASVIASQYAYKSAMRSLQGMVGVAAASALGYTSFEDEEDKEGTFSRELAGSILDVTNASSGNISKIPVNMAVGYLDTKYGRDIGLRQGLRGYGTSVGFGYDPKKPMDENVKNSLLSASGSYGVANKDINSLVDAFMEGNVTDIVLKGASLSTPIPLLKDINSAKSYIKYNTIPSIEDQKETYKSGSSKDIKELEKNISNYVNTIVYNKYIKAYKERGGFNSSDVTELNKELSKNIHNITVGDYNKYIDEAVKNAKIRIKVRTGKVSKEAESYLQMKDSEIKSDLIIRYRDANDEEKKRLVKVMQELADLDKISQGIVNDIKRIKVKSE